MRVAITNFGRIVPGDWRSPFAAGDTRILDVGLISHVGTASSELHLALGKMPVGWGIAVATDNNAAGLPAKQRRHRAGLRGLGRFL